MKRIFLVLFGVAVASLPATGATRPAAKGDRPQPERPGGAPASFSVHTFKAADGRALEYGLFVPPAPKPGARLPLVLCLHGAGGNTEAARVLAAPAQQAKHPCIIMAPRCDPRTGRWVAMPLRPVEQRSVMPELLGALDHVIAAHPVDPDRIYVTGQSMGGVGTWGLMASEPQRFAAAVPVCGIWTPADASKMTRVPVWAFHGENDPTVPVTGSRDMIAALKAAGASPKYTEYPGVGHNSWSPAYATDELWEWLFAQRRGAAAASLPKAPRRN